MSENEALTEEQLDAIRHVCAGEVSYRTDGWRRLIFMEGLRFKANGQNREMDAVLVLNHDNGRVRFDLPPWAGAMLAAIDGRRTLADIHAALGGDSYDRFKAEFDAVYAPFNAANAMYLRYLP